MKILVFLIIVIGFISCKKPLKQKDLVGKWIVTDYNSTKLNDKPYIIKESRKFALNTSYQLNIDSSCYTIVGTPLNNRKDLWLFNPELNQLTFIYPQNYKTIFTVTSYEDTLMKWTKSVSDMGEITLTLEREKEKEK